MPTIITCSQCGQVYAVHEMQVGQHVGCPACRCPQEGPEPTPRRRARSTPWLAVVFLGVVGLCVLVFGGVAVWALTRPTPKAAPRVVAKAEPQAPAPAPVIEKVAQGPPTKAAPPSPNRSPVAKKEDTDGPYRKAPPPAPEPPTTFDEAWKLAEVILDKQQEDEPEKRAKAMKLLTAQEAANAQNLLFHIESAKQLEVIDPDIQRRLDRFGLELTLYVISAKTARKSKDFLSTVRKLWHRDMPPSQLAHFASFWYRLNYTYRHRLMIAVRSDTKTSELDPDTRDTFLLLGCKKWLEDH